MQSVYIDPGDCFGLFEIGAFGNILQFTRFQLCLIVINHAKSNIVYFLVSDKNQRAWRLAFGFFSFLEKSCHDDSSIIFISGAD
jgi:hypothetical protein